ncbi:zwei Ig domain protein zig-8-like [Spodoptera litura]|uniref:Zwei Ig domain protein zig-8-like n=1 Tax=Spodoptera litura TaxID=69820 RepID=A0A9J7J4Y6_SPOLT|nr:zwei Ig domain protein zig-8-like [Spodoptera litura]
MLTKNWRIDMHTMNFSYRLKIGIIVIVIMVLGFFNESQGTAHYGEDSVGSFPYFEYNVPRNVTTVVGQTAFLHCRVEQLGDKAVSWIRKRDLHILTAGILTYTSDQRFQVIRPEKSENWTLQIKFPQERDAGIYECQVNTEPKMSLAFQLNVVEAKAHILGPVDLYVKTGSSLSLTCILSQGPHDLGTIFWYKGSNIIEYKELEENELVEEPRVRLKTEWTEQLTSRLTVEKLLPGDSGNYSCVPTMAEAASVNVHVINGEQPAAMQHGNANTASPCALSVNLLISLYCTLATLYTSTVDGFR